MMSPGKALESVRKKTFRALYVMRKWLELNCRKIHWCLSWLVSLLLEEICRSCWSQWGKCCSIHIRKNSWGNIRVELSWWVLNSSPGVSQNACFMDTSESSILQSSSENQLDQMKTLQKSFFEMDLLGWEENKTSSLMTEILFSNFSKAQEILFP